jgi:putative aldouronate transport system permease protein
MKRKEVGTMTREEKDVTGCKSKQGFLHDLVVNRIKWLMLLPSIIVVIVMCYIPMGGIVLAFKNYNYHDGIFGSPWVGFDNFKFFFMSGKIWSITKNTIFYNILFLVIGTLLAIACAIMLAEMTHIIFKRVSQSFMFLPYFISWVVVGAIVYNLFNYEFGAVNTLLKSLGREPLDIYSNQEAWIPILVAANVFKTLGYSTTMYLASIMNIDDQLYEAAGLDGASMWQKIWHITLPAIKPTIVILFLLAIGTIMKGDFQMFWQVTGNNPMVYEVTDVIDTYVTRCMLSMQEYGMTSAVGFYQSVFSFILIIIANTIVKKVEPDYSLF